MPFSYPIIVYSLPTPTQYLICYFPDFPEWDWREIRGNTFRELMESASDLLGRSLAGRTLDSLPEPSKNILVPVRELFALSFMVSVDMYKYDEDLASEMTIEVFWRGAKQRIEEERRKRIEEGGGGEITEDDIPF